jgi:hypothetical protein
MRLLPALLLVSGLAYAGDYEGELGIRIWGGYVQPSLFDARVQAYDEDAWLKGQNWSGLLNADDLSYGAAAGAEASWGFHPKARVLVAFEGGGTSASARYEGQGPRTFDDPYRGLMRQRMGRLDRYSQAGIEAGLTLLLTDFEWCRLGLTGRAGIHRLSAAVERGNDWGPYGDHWWNRSLTGTAPGGMLGIEWEMPDPFPSLPFGLGGYVLAGYRVLEFRRIDYRYTDSAGISDKGLARLSDGSRFTLDFGGPELRFGVQATIPLNPAQ